MFMEVIMKREQFGSRLGFILVSAGCAIGLGNVWKFPYMAGKYGGAAFILVYLLFLVILGLPIIVCEFSVGRASQKSIATSYNALEPPRTKWHYARWAAIAGNYLLVMFYSMVGGWMLYYCFRMAKGEFTGVTASEVSEKYAGMLSSYTVLLDGTGHPTVLWHLQHRSAKGCGKDHESDHALSSGDHGHPDDPFCDAFRLFGRTSLLPGSGF